MFRVFQFQRNTLSQDPIDQYNWQVLTDNTKGNHYTPTTANIGNVASTTGFYSLLGPWVLVNATVTGSTSLTSTGTSTISLPTQILSQNNVVTVVYQQYLTAFNNNNSTTASVLNNGGTNSSGQALIPAAFFGTETIITIQGIYLRN